MTGVIRHVTVRGRVQGVGYRAFVADEADARSLEGWVRNCPDGSVELIAEGERAMLEELERWCRQGPPGAVVRQADMKWQDATNEFDAFLIRR